MERPTEGEGRRRPAYEGDRCGPTTGEAEVRGVLNSVGPNLTSGKNRFGEDAGL